MRRRELGAAGGALALGLLPSARASTLDSPLLAFTEHLPPLNFAGRHGEVQGFSSELLRLMADQAGMALELQLMPWPRAVKAAAAQANHILYSLTRLPDREGRYRWVGPISERRLMLYRMSEAEPLPKLRELRDLQQLGERKIGVVRESAAAQLLHAQGLRAGAELELALDDSSNLRKLLARRMDLIAMLDWGAAWHLKQQGLHYTTLTPVMVLDSRRSYWYGLHPDSEDRVVHGLQAALDQLRRDGRYAKLRGRYFS